MLSYFKNEWYPFLIIIVLAIVITTRVMDILSNWNLISFFHLVLSFLVLISLLFKTTITEIIVKVWSGLSVIGGTLGLISILMYLIANATEKIELPKLLIHTIHLSIGIIIFKYWDESVNEGKAISFEENSDILDAPDGSRVQDKNKKL